jgi:nucleoside-diphosphate-sugar epimerase
MFHIVIAGCGYIGQALAVQALADGRRVAALARSAEVEAHLRSMGVHAVRGDLDQPETLRGVPAAESCLYYLAPPPPSGTSDPRVEGLLQALGPENRPARLVYISTTGVYGDCGGEWVTEARPVAPQAARARRRVAAEQALGAWGAANRVPLVILRVPGIYGPGRLPVARLRRGEPVLREAESGYSNRIHATDLVRACLAAGQPHCPPGVYNVSDGCPTSMTEYFYRVADALGLQRPQEISLAEARNLLSPAMLEYLRESKRIDNRKMREVLGVTPVYPDLATGLPACVGASSP